jgi:hypothetical protein
MLPFLGLIGIAVLWLAWRRRRVAPVAAAD